MKIKTDADHEEAIKILTGLMDDEDLPTDWSKKLNEFEKQELAERIVLLKDHDEKWRIKKKVLYIECHHDGGHDYQPLNGEFARPHFMTGEWPEACTKCRKPKPRSNS